MNMKVLRRGVDWVVISDEWGSVWFACCRPEDLLEFTEPPEEEDGR